MLRGSRAVLAAQGRAPVTMVISREQAKELLDGLENAMGVLGYAIDTSPRTRRHEQRSAEEGV